RRSSTPTCRASNATISSSLSFEAKKSARTRTQGISTTARRSKLSSAQTAECIDECPNVEGLGEDSSSFRAALRNLPARRTGHDHGWDGGERRVPALLLSKRPAI